MKLANLILAAIFSLNLSPSWASDDFSSSRRASKDLGEMTLDRPRRASADDLKREKKSSTLDLQKEKSRLKDPFQMEIERSRSTPLFDPDLSKKQGGVGDYGGTDDLKEKLLNIRKQLAGLLKSLNSIKDIENLWEARKISEDTFNILRRELSVAESDYKPKLGLSLRAYLSGMQMIFIEGACPQQGVADYPFAFRVVEGMGYLCVSRSMLRQHNYSDEQLSVYLLHETLHFTGLRDHIIAQNIADELFAALQPDNIPDCKINSALKSENGLIHETVPRCKLKIPEGEYIVTLYSTKYGQGFRLNDDTYMMIKRNVYYSLIGSGGTHIYNINTTLLCPEQQETLNLEQMMKLFSTRQIYAKILYSYWGNPTTGDTAIVGVTSAAFDQLKVKDEYWPYLNFSINGTGIGVPRKFHSNDSNYISAYVCLIPIDKIKTN